VQIGTWSNNRCASLALRSRVVARPVPLIRRAIPADAAAIANLWLRSWAAALPTVTRAHADDDVREYTRDVLVPTHETWVMVLEPLSQEALVGFMVLGDGWIEQLYLEPDYIGRGLGVDLVDLAKEQCPDGLQLWTFAVNAPARRFYGRQGFVEVEETDGAGNEERAPDVRLVWHPQT